MFAAGRPAARSAYISSPCWRHSHVRKSWSEPVFLLTQDRLHERNGPGTWTRLENYRTLEFTNLPSISPQSDFLGCCFFRLVFKHPKFGDFFFRIHGSQSFSVALLDRILLHEADKNGEQRSNSLSVNTFE